MLGPCEEHDAAAAAARAHRRLMCRNLSPFACVWLGITAGWIAALSVEGLLRPLLTLPALALQAAILAAPLRWARAEPHAPRILPLVVATCVCLGIAAIAVFAATGASGDFLAFILLTLYLAAALFFVWGWRAELGLLVATVIPWVVATPALVFHVPTVELVTAIFTGSAICLAIAEGGARNFTFAHHHRVNDEWSRRELEASRNAYRDLAEKAERARAEAEAATRARDQFMAMLSHELRSPLGAVVTWVRMLQRDLVSAEKVPRALAAIDEAARAQVRLTEDLLDISRIAAGKLSLHMEEVDLGPVVAGRVDAVRGDAEAKRITLDVRVEPLAGTVRGDPTRLQQIVENLLSNALKFTPKGGRVSVALEGRDGEAQLTVSDTGIGIPAVVLPHVFEQFQQADSSITRHYGGLGLGLAIARRLVEMHGGHIEVESGGAKQGATFRVHVPLVPRAAAADGSSRGDTRMPLPTLDRLRVLVVDDEPAGREVLATLLSRCGAEVRSAASVREALERFATRRPDVVVTDIAMPDEDGYALLRAIRSHDARIPAIAVTALASEQDRTRALAEGFAAHLTKPVDPTELVSVVARSAPAST